MLGILDRNKNLENTLILAIKRYIYVCKCNKKKHKPERNNNSLAKFEKY